MSTLHSRISEGSLLIWSCIMSKETLFFKGISRYPQHYREAIDDICYLHIINKFLKISGIIVSNSAVE